MFKHSKDLALFLEQMRFSRGISQEEFTDGIISNRQYQRYINGSSAMPYHLLDGFAEKLNTKKEILLLEFDNYALKETIKVVEYYNFVNNDEFEKAKELARDISPKFILDNYNLKLYQHAKSFLDFKEDKVSKFDFVTFNKELIDYPKMLTHSAMTMIESVILSSLLLYTESADQNKIFPKIQSYLSNPSLIWTGSEILTFNMLIFLMAKYSGMRKDYKNVILFCKMGISANTKSKYSINLDYYYYFLALAYYHTNEHESYEESLYKCYVILESMNHPSKTEKMVTLLKKDFNINLYEFAIDYQIKKHKEKTAN